MSIVKDDKILMEEKILSLKNFGIIHKELREALEAVKAF